MRISVAFGVENHARTLGPLLESLTEQKRLPDELVVVDDRSRDDSRAIVEDFARRAPFPVVARVNERRFGPAANYGIAMDTCTGDLVAMCHPGDRWYPERLSQAADAFADDPQLGLTFSDADIEPSGRTLWEAVGFTEQRSHAARRGGLLPLVVAYPFVSAATTTIRGDLRELVVPVPEHVSLDRWIGVLAPLVRSYAVLEGCLLYHGAPADEAAGAVMPDETGLSRWRARLHGTRRKIAAHNAYLHRQRRRAEASLFDSILTRFAEAGAPYLERHGLDPQPRAAQTLDDIRERVRHLRLRGDLPDRRLERVPAIAKELRSGRYNRYSAGVLSALQDLAY